MDWIDARSSPNPTSGGLFPKYVSPNQPFLERPEEATMTFQVSSNQAPLATMIVHRKSLLKLLPQREHWSSRTHTIRWDDWCSEVVLFDTSWNLKFVTSGQHGQRCVIFRSSSEATKSPFDILDFNKHRNRRAQAAGAVVNKAGSLLFVATKLPENFVHNTVYASDTGLLGLNVRDIHSIHPFFR